VEINCGSKTPEMFDAVIFACSAENALAMLTDASPLKRFVLGGVEYCESLVVTHTDEEYLQQHYTYKSSEGIQYYTRNDPQNTERLEISFDLREYQPCLKEKGLTVF
jgi:predicted NAD/FAD-binding protein